MKKYAIGFILGAVLSTVIYIPILILEQNNKYELGHNQGTINGLLHSVNDIEKEFGKYSTKDNYKTLYSVKTSEVISLEINGVKTIRVIP